MCLNMITILSLVIICHHTEILELLIIFPMSYISYPLLFRNQKFVPLNLVQFNSVTKSCMTLCDPMDCSMPGFPGSPTPTACSNLHSSSQWCYSTISSSVVSFSSCLQSFPWSGSFPMSQFFASGGQNIRVSALASVFPWIFRTDFL